MIHHYTSIQTLALILKSKVIRFTRLDLVDDIKEIEGLPKSFGTYIFVSCWTEKDEENISLWSLYTRMRGVRISFPIDMFKKYTIQAGDYGNWGFGEDTVSPLSLEKIRTDDYWIFNPFWLEDGFYTKVIYDKNHINLKEILFNNELNGLEISKAQSLAGYKDSIWEFQNESRFYLLAIPLSPLQNFNGNRLAQMANLKYTINKIENRVSFIDVELDEEVLNNIVVRLYPSCKEADKIIVNALLKEYTSNGSLELSHLENTIRGK